MAKKVISDIKKLATKDSRARLRVIHELISTLSSNPRVFSLLILKYVACHDPDEQVKSTAMEFLKSKGISNDCHWEEYTSF